MDFVSNLGYVVELNGGSESLEEDDRDGYRKVSGISSHII